MLETYITNLKKSHMTPFIIFMMIYIGFFNVIGLFVSNVWNRVPIIIHIMIFIWIVSCLIIIKQDSYNKIKMNQYVALRYLIVNVFAGYMQPIALSVVTLLRVLICIEMLLIIGSYFNFLSFYL